MEALKKLRLSRGQLKGTVTRIENFISDPINIAASSTEMLEARKEKLITTFKEYEVVQLDILSLDPDDNEDESTLENKYFSVISKLNAALKSLNTNEVRTCSNVSTSKLPHLDIPIFSGKDYTKYTSFIDLFTAVIDNNSSLSDVQKLFYLRKFLTEDALAVIVNLPLVNQSYREALVLLKKRFDNRARLISNHINVILELPSMQKGTATALRAFISQVQQQLHALKNLEQPVNTWDMLLITLLSKKLDLYTCRAYQLDRNMDMLPTMEEFISFLEKRAMALEDTVESKKTTIQNKVSNVVTKNKSTNQCLYCNGTDHAMYVCPRFKTAPIEDRTKFVESKKLCTMCLKNHTGKCRFSFTCKVCRAGHNTLLHKDTIPAAERSVSLHSHDASVNILLPTIRVKLIDRHGSDIYVRALLDSASQVSFVTTELVEKLGLKTKSQTSNIVGIGNKNQTINKCVDLTLHSPVNDYVKLNVKFNVVDSITSNLPQHSFDISKLKIPKNICLADENCNVTDVISMLLSAEIYFSILLPNGLIKIDNGPVLQNTLFGYTLAGNIPSKTIVHNNKCESRVTNLAICNSNKMEEVMEQFWLAEGIPQAATKQNTQEFQKSESYFNESVQLQDKKFIVKMPLIAKKAELQLGDSFSVAHQRFLTLE